MLLDTLRWVVLRHTWRGKRACFTNSTTQRLWMYELQIRIVILLMLVANPGILAKNTCKLGKAKVISLVGSWCWYIWSHLGIETSKHRYNRESSKGNCGHHGCTSNSNYPLCGSRYELKYKGHELQVDFEFNCTNWKIL